VEDPGIASPDACRPPVRPGADELPQEIAITARLQHPNILAVHELYYVQLPVHDCGLRSGLRLSAIKAVDIYPSPA